MNADLQNRGSQVQVLSPLLREAPALVHNRIGRALRPSGSESGLVTDSSPDDDLRASLRRVNRHAARSAVGVLAAAILAFLALSIVVPEPAGAAPVTPLDCRGVATYTIGTARVKRAAALGCIRYRDAQRIEACGARAGCVIRIVFGPYGAQAVSVATCESGLSTRAANGQYLGLFQMGSGERARWGHGSTPAAQSWAAWRYFNASGRDWSPWECKPGGPPR